MDYSFKWEFSRRFGTDYESASKELGKSPRTLKRYVQQDECDQTVKILLSKLQNEFIHPNWDECYWLDDGNIRTPYGITKPSDIALVHRYKWHSQAASLKIKSLEKEIEELKNGKESHFEKLENSLLETLGILAQRNA